MASEKSREIAGPIGSRSPGSRIEADMAAIAAATSGLALAALDPRIAEAARDAVRGGDKPDAGNDRPPDHDGARPEQQAADYGAAHAVQPEAPHKHGPTPTPIDTAHVSADKAAPAGGVASASTDALESAHATVPHPEGDAGAGTGDGAVDHAGAAPSHSNQPDTHGAAETSSPAIVNATGGAAGLDGVVANLSGEVASHASAVVDQLNADAGGLVEAVGRDVGHLAGAASEAMDLTSGAVGDISPLAETVGGSAVDVAHDVASSVAILASDVTKQTGAALDQAGEIASALPDHVSAVVGDVADTTGLATAPVQNLAEGLDAPFIAAVPPAVAEAVDHAASPVAGLMESVIDVVAPSAPSETENSGGVAAASDVPAHLLGAADHEPEVGGVPAETLGKPPAFDPAIASAAVEHLPPIDDAASSVGLHDGGLQLGFLGESYAHVPDLQDGALSSGLHGLI